MTDKSHLTFAQQYDQAQAAADATFVKRSRNRGARCGLCGDVATGVFCPMSRDGEGPHELGDGSGHRIHDEPYGGAE